MRRRQRRHEYRQKYPLRSERESFKLSPCGLRMLRLADETALSEIRYLSVGEAFIVQSPRCVHGHNNNHNGR